MYDRKLETIPGAKEKYDESQRSAASARLKIVADKKRKKKLEKKESQA
jgi:hypothetical protein